MTTEPNGADECGWCSDYRSQHDETGCRICGHAPWEQREYKCDRFYETREEAAAAFKARRIAIYGHEKGKTR